MSGYRGGGGGGGGGGGPSSAREGQVYIGNLPPDVKSRDIEDIFFKFGKINFVNLKNNNGNQPFAFIEFEDPRDADDAIRERDGYNYDGYVLRVELPHAVGGGRGRPRSSRGNDYGSRSRGGPPSGGRRSDYRVIISDLPKTASWQDLKDHMREAGDICYADVMSDGTGVIEYTKYDDMKYAIKKLDDTKFKSHEGDVSYIRVEEDTGKSRSRRRSRSASRSRSPARK